MKERILRNIARNSRLSTEDLAAMLSASPEEIRGAVEQMEKEGVICGYPTLINWDKIDAERVTALIELKVTPERGRGFDRAAERIYQFDEVESLYLMSGGYDLAVFIEGKNLREVAAFVSEKLSVMDKVLSTATHFILKKYKIGGEITVSASTENKRQPVTP